MRYPIFFLTLILLSCGNPEQKEVTVQDTKGELLAEIEAVEGIVGSSSKELLGPKGGELIILYKGFVENNPMDERNPAFLMSAGKLLVARAEFEEGLIQYEKILKNYKDFEKAPEAAFMVAFIYDEHLNQKGKASEMYERVIELFPRSRWALDSKASIQLLNMSDEDIIKMLEEKNKDKESGSDNS